MSSGASSNFRRSPDREMVRIGADGNEIYKEIKFSSRKYSKYHCVHGRDCSECPKKILNEIRASMIHAAYLLEELYETFDNTKIRSINILVGKTFVHLDRESK